MYEFTLLDVHLAVESLQWRNIELLQALRLNTLAAIAPYSEQPPSPRELYQLPSDAIGESEAYDAEESSIERARRRVEEFERRQKEMKKRKETNNG